jgi:hypothetical protein
MKSNALTVAGGDVSGSDGYGGDVSGSDGYGGDVSGSQLCKAASQRALPLCAPLEKPLQLR